MHIEFIEIQNFRKLKSTRIDLKNSTSIFVGANNSGKTSAIEAIDNFLVNKSKMKITDFTISNWDKINEIGNLLEKTPEKFEFSLWDDLLPSLDLWINATKNEIHHITHLIPTLSWDEELIGIRIRFEPEIESLNSDYIKERQKSVEAIKLAKKNKSLKIWPSSMQDFLSTKLNKYFNIKYYLLDPKHIFEKNEEGYTVPQNIPSNSESITEQILNGLIKVDIVNAQRELSDSKENNISLSSKLNRHYIKHIENKSELSEDDVKTLEAIKESEKSFDKSLASGFEKPLDELSQIGYPGVQNPKIKISTKVKPIEGLNHESAVEYALDQNKNLHLPEAYNGLGYKNLISIIFDLMDFRDSWIQEIQSPDRPSPLIHLVIIEEPEAHLHPQVQKVFINNALNVLQNHELIKSNQFNIQMIVSTHSSHIVHECDFSKLRYFKRISKSHIDSNIPLSIVINMHDIFGNEEKTTKFVTRYLKSTHCELFFADATILIEGAAERILIPHFIEHNFKKLSRNYISILEIGGAHAHRLKPFIEKLNLTTLIITDLDSAEKNSSKKVRAQRNKEQITTNSTLKEWIPKLSKIDDLIATKKLVNNDNIEFNLRVAYQQPINITFPLGQNTKVEVIPYTFEDALFFENLELFKTIEGHGLIPKFKGSLEDSKTIEDLQQKIYNNIQGSSDKARFALDILIEQDPSDLNIPEYINEGLQWLEMELNTTEKESLEVKKNG